MGFTQIKNINVNVIIFVFCDNCKWLTIVWFSNVTVMKHKHISKLINKDELDRLLLTHNIWHVYNFEMYIYSMESKSLR